MIFLDTNILVDLTDRGAEWHSWAKNTLARQDRIQIVTNFVALAEFARRFSSALALDSWTRAFPIRVVPLDVSTAFRAGIAFNLYRRRGGPRTAILPDFLIGAHATVLGATLLTRDHARFVSYFPELALITPETEP